MKKLDIEISVFDKTRGILFKFNPGEFGSLIQVRSMKVFDLHYFAEDNYGPNRPLFRDIHCGGIITEDFSQYPQIKNYFADLEKKEKEKKISDLQSQINDLKKEIEGLK